MLIFVAHNTTIKETEALWKQGFVDETELTQLLNEVKALNISTPNLVEIELAKLSASLEQVKEWDPNTLY